MPNQIKLVMSPTVKILFKIILNYINVFVGGTGNMLTLSFAEG